jgi:hypothetical protein
VQPDEGRRSDTYNGHTVHSVLSDYQDRSHGGDGWLRIYEFSPSNNVIRVRTYSPTLGRFEADADSSSQFTLPYDMKTAGSTFQPVASVSGLASGATASVTWNGLSPMTTYEWYAVVSDGVRTTTGPTWQFTTGSSAITEVIMPPTASTDEFAGREADGLVLSASLRPNPISREGVLELVLTRPGFARGDLFDATGRRVGSLMDEPSLTAGPHQIPIATHGPGGSPLPTGMYFYRIETAEGMLHGRMVVIN